MERERERERERGRERKQRIRRKAKRFKKLDWENRKLVGNPKVP